MWEPPPPPPKRPNRGRSYSVRSDPLEWLFYGRLNFELEAEILPFLSVELSPMFITNSDPAGLEATIAPGIRQHSAGWGPLSGGALSVGFWPQQRALRGTVLRLIFSNQAVRYRTSVDEATRLERRLLAYFGSHTVYSGFTIVGGFGLGFELNRQRRCFSNGPSSNCKDDDYLIDLGNGRAVDMNSWAHPLVTVVRISLGVTF